MVKTPWERRQVIRAQLFLPSSWIWKECGTRSYRLKSQSLLCPHCARLVVHKMGFELAMLWLKTVATIKWSSGYEDLMVRARNPRCQA